MDFEEYSPHQEGIISEMYISPNQSFFEKPQELIDLVDTSKLVHGYLQKQTYKNIGCYKEKGVKRNTFTPYHQRGSSRIFKKSKFQGHTQIFGTK